MNGASKWIIAALGAVLTVSIGVIAWGFQTVERVSVVEAEVAQHEQLDVPERLRAIERQLATQTEALRSLAGQVEELKLEVRKLR